MPYVVKKQYARGPEIYCDEFKVMGEARLYIEKKMQEDASLNVKVVYTISEYNEVIEVFEPGKVDFGKAAASSAQDQGAQGKGNAASFRPTPFNVTPRPPGTPPNWMQRDDDEDDDKK